MRLAIIACVFVAHALAAGNVGDMHKMIQNKLDQVSKKAQLQQVGEEPSAACTAAFEALSNSAAANQFSTTNCSSALGGVGLGLVDTTGDIVNERCTAFANDCGDSAALSDVVELASALIRECLGASLLSDEGQAATFALANVLPLLLTQVYCLEVDGERCLPQILEHSSAVDVPDDTCLAQFAGEASCDNACQEQAQEALGGVNCCVTAWISAHRAFASETSFTGEPITVNLDICGTGLPTCAEADEILDAAGITLQGAAAVAQPAFALALSAVAAVVTAVNF